LDHLTQAQLQTLFGSKEGKALLTLLQKNSGQTLQQAAEAAKAGDYARAQSLLQPMLGEDIRKLAGQLGEKLG